MYGIYAISLPLCELEGALVIGIVHEIVDWIEPGKGRARACILGGRAAFVAAFSAGVSSTKSLSFEQLPSNV